jgi:uncharacterized protein YwgA
MSHKPSRKSEAEKAADIVRDAGGKIIGRTRMQKIAYLFELAGVGEGFSFAYRNFGPYSDELTGAMQSASALGLVEEDEKPSSWDGYYSIFVAAGPSRAAASPLRAKIARQVVEADAIELELAATAAYLANKGIKDPWTETGLRKPIKAARGRLKKARSFISHCGKFRLLNDFPTSDFPISNV